MEVGMDIEDELYFADLNKQISLLIMDDDDQVPLSHNASVSIQEIKWFIKIEKKVYPALDPSISRLDNRKPRVLSRRSTYKTSTSRQETINSNS